MSQDIKRDRSRGKTSKKKTQKKCWTEQYTSTDLALEQKIINSSKIGLHVITQRIQNKDEADHSLLTLTAEFKDLWQNTCIFDTRFAKTKCRGYKHEPKATVSQNDGRHPYKYNKYSRPTVDMSDESKRIRDLCKQKLFPYANFFNVCLAARYRDGDDYISDHQDLTTGMDQDKTNVFDRPAFMGVSYGAKRELIFKAKKNINPCLKKLKDFKIDLEHGHAYWVSFKTNQWYSHQIRPQKEAKERVSLTYRYIKNWDLLKNLKYNDAVYDFVYPFNALICLKTPSLFEQYFDNSYKQQMKKLDSQQVIRLNKLAKEQKKKEIKEKFQDPYDRLIKDTHKYAEGQEIYKGRLQRLTFKWNRFKDNFNISDFQHLQNSSFILKQKKMEKQEDTPDRALTKPVFIKVGELKPRVHGYNCFVTVVSAEHETIKRVNGETLDIATAVVGDDTGVCNVRITGPNAEFIKEGNVLALRNGRSVVFQEHMRLEIDRWGKISMEDVDVGKVNMENNLSETFY